MKVLETYIDDFIFHCRYEKGLSSKTIKAYQIDLKQFSGFIRHNSQRTTDIDQIDKHLLRSYIKHVSTDNKPKTIKRKLATLKAFFSMLEFEDTILVNPFRKIRLSIKEGKLLPRTISRHDITHLFSAVYKQQEKCATSPTATRTLARDIAVIELLFAAGVRVAELCDLRDEDVDLKRGSIRIMGKGTRERVIPLCSKETVNALVFYVELYCHEIDTAGWFFINRNGNRFSEQSVRFMLKKYVTNADISEKITPHMFRHSVATQLLENGVDIRYIQTFLGHSSITTTQIYAQVTEEFQRVAIETKHPRSGMMDN